MRMFKRRTTLIIAARDLPLLLSLPEPAGAHRA
jgi:hypothetical protein